MSRRKKLVLFAIPIIVVLIILIFKIMPQSIPIPLPHTTASHAVRVIGWIPNWDQQNAVDSYMQEAGHIQYISVFWYRLDASGNLTIYQATNEDPAIIAFAHAHKQKIFALVANLPDYYENKDWDFERVEKVISTEDGRQHHIQAILQLLNEKNFDGVDIDYEALKTFQRNNFSLFIAELSQALHKENKLLGVAIYPPDPTQQNADFGEGAQDVVLLSRYADQLYLMTYLEHTLSSPPGPIGSLPWVQKSLDYTLNTLNISPEKVFMGIGLMGIAWRQNFDGSIVGDRDDISFDEITSLSQSMGVNPSFDSSSQSPFLVFDDENGKHIIWFENTVSIGEKITLAKKLGIGGVALWRLGGEDKTFWQYL